MPGPISQSYDPDPIRRRWAETLAIQGFRYFVFKARDVFAALNDDELEQFDTLVQKMEQHRLAVGKTKCRSFWVYARHWPCADEVKALMEDLLGIVMGKQYPPSDLGA